MAREPGLSVRFKLTLSYAGFLMVAGGLLLAVVWLYLLRYVPPEAIQTIQPESHRRDGEDRKEALHVVSKAMGA